MSITVLRTIKEVRSWRLEKIISGKSVGFVPTMGALHAGHRSLVQQSLQENDSTIISIFVNPSQFAPTEDLDSYPRTFDADLKLLGAISTGNKTVDAVFAPKVSEMYPSGVPLEVAEQKGAFVSVHGVSEQLEGAKRPQFFRGVATIVTKLFNVVNPTKAYFGQKDAQQTVVVKRLVKDLLIPTEVIVLPTIREDSGLALSSRNAYLSNKVRDESQVIYEALHAGEELYNTKKVTSGSVILQEIEKVLEPYTNGKLGSFTVEYISINHPETLEILSEVIPGEGAIISTAVRVPNSNGGEARLIDNVILG